MKKEWGLFALSLALIFFLIVGVGEILLRSRYGMGALPKALGGGLPPHLVIPDEALGYTLTPGFVGRTVIPGHSPVEDRINRQGLRDYEREFPAGAELIIAVGDSMTYGHGVAFEEIWPTVLENKIRQDSPQHTLVKAGVPGFSWPQIAGQYKKIAETLEHHPLVIVGFTVDAGERLTQPYEAKGGVIVKSAYPNLAVLEGLVYEKPSRHETFNRMDAFLRTHSYFFRWFNQRIFFVYHQLKKILAQTPQGEERKNAPSPLRPLERWHVQEAISTLHSIHEMARDKGAGVLVLFIARPNEYEDEIAAYERVLSQKGIHSLDLSKFEDTARWRFQPGGHWNAYGSGQVAQRIYEFIKEGHLLD